MKLYTYWRSTSAYRVRIALALKGLTATHIPIHLAKGEQNEPEYRAVNPQGRVPTLVLDNGTAIMQSPAIIEYLEEVFPEPAFLPADPAARAVARSIAAIIGCDIHPLHNVGPLNYLRQNYERTEEDISAWISQWILNGLSAVESMVGDSGYCMGATLGLADIYLVPQLYAARRFGVDLGQLPKVLRIEQLAAAHPEMHFAHPKNQIDASG